MTVINKIPIMTEPSWLNYLLIVLSIIFLVFFILTLIYCTEALGNIFGVCTVISGILCASCLIVCISPAFDVPTERCRYECTFYENVSIVEIYDNYNIIEQRGNIWVLEDKGD